MHWQPSTSLIAIKQRAELYRKIREFFAERGVLEVETPLLSEYGVTDIHIENITAAYYYQEKKQEIYLQTSPEYAMKRLLAQYHQPIYQISKAFRHDECGQFHNPEFTLLEWYRPGFTHHQLMDEMDALLQSVLNSKAAQRFSYQAVFQQYCRLDPHRSSLAECLNCLEQNHIQLTDAAKNISKDSALQLLMSHMIEPNLGVDAPAFIYDYPSSQAALAKISPENSAVAHRFEVYIQGVELANGFHELADAEEQEHRFKQDQNYRQQHGLAHREIDQRFIGALKYGLPDCAGVALGIDRLLMILLKEKHIQQVINFCWGNI